MADFLGGIGMSARNLWTPNTQTPPGHSGHTGIHMGIVVDDIDDFAEDSQHKQSLGRVWVYVPGISARNPELRVERYTPTREPPGQDGAPGKPIAEKRGGFILAYPVTDGGSDRVREQPNQPDGRNPRAGQSNAYGNFVQARNGDLIACFFMNNDPGRCYVLGHIPKTDENAMVPGLKQGKTNAQGDGVSTPVGPTYNVGTDDNTQTVPFKTFFNNLTDSGLIQDPLRGNGSSASDRESPSRVRGMKTPGDPDTAMGGHQFVMDDHPDSQMVRMRTSKGSQLLMSDTGDFIYMNTATGKVWMELDDAGNMHVYAHSSINFHTEQDFNFTSDRDLNFHVGGNINMLAKGKTQMRMSKGMDLTVGESGGDFNVTTINNLHFKTQGEIRMAAQQNLSMKSAQKINMQASNDFNAKIGGKFNAKASSDFNMDTGSNMNATKGSLSVDDAPAPNQAGMPLLHSVASPPPTDRPPVSPKTLSQYATDQVPQHEPWKGHRGLQTGHNKAVSPSSIPKLLS